MKLNCSQKFFLFQRMFFFQRKQFCSLHGQNRSPDEQHRTGKNSLRDPQCTCTLRFVMINNLFPSYCTNTWWNIINKNENTASVFAQQHMNATWASLTRTECLEWGGQVIGPACDYVPDITLMSFILFFGTYTCSMGLKKFKTSRFFPTTVNTHKRQHHTLMRTLIRFIILRRMFNPRRKNTTCPNTHVKLRSERHLLSD